MSATTPGTAALINGIPWVNTLAADSQGNALYADYSVKPYVTDAKLVACTTSAVAKAATAAGLPTLDGSKAACNPDADPAVRQAGILPPGLLPMLQRTDYVANSNNTYWLTNPAEPITGLPVSNGAAGTDLGLRPRAGLVQIADRLAGRDELRGNRFSLHAVQAILIGTRRLPMGNRNYAAELMGDAELDIRPVTEAWDLGLAEKPADDPTVRYMALFKAGANYEAGRLPGGRHPFCIMVRPYPWGMIRYST